MTAKGAIARRLAVACFGFGCAVATVAPVGASDEDPLHFASEDGRFSLDLGARVQLRLTHDDPETGDSGTSFRVRRARLTLEGKVFEHWDYKLQADLGGDSTDLLDASFQYARHEAAQLWMGQGKVEFGLQELISSGKQQFVDRSIASNRFSPGRDQGIALKGDVAGGRLYYAVGAYNGNGINRSSNDDDEFLWTGRAVWSPFGPVKMAEGALERPESSRLAVGLAALSTSAPERTSIVQVLEPDGSGGFTGNILDVVQVDAPASDTTRFGLEALFKRGGLSASGEWFVETLEPAGAADVDTDGGWVQVGWLFEGTDIELAGRWSAIRPDLPGADRTETGLGVSWYPGGHSYKLQADLRELEDDATGETDRQIRAQLQWAF